MFFFIRKSLSWSKFKDLKGKTIGTTLGYTYGLKMDLLFEKAKRYFPAEIISNLRRLIKGSIDLFPVEPTIAKYYLKNSKIEDPISANLLTLTKNQFTIIDSTLS